MKRSEFRKLSLEEIREKARKLSNQQRRGVTSPKRSKTPQRARRAQRNSALAAFRLTVRVRDNYTCQWPLCGYYDKYIDVQHIAKRSQRPDLVTDPNNGVCLCPTHHNLADNTLQGRRLAKQLGLAGGETYEKAKKAEFKDSL